MSRFIAGKKDKERSSRQRERKTKRHKQNVVPEIFYFFAPLSMHSEVVYNMSNTCKLVLSSRASDMPAAMTVTMHPNVAVA